MATTNKLWLVAPLALGLIVAACGDDDSSATEAPEATVEAAAETTPEPEDEGGNDDAGGAVTVAMLDGEEITIESTLCYFEEQERAGLGGVWTHTTQARGTNADGEPVIVSLDRARDEDGTVGDSVIVDIGDPASDDFVGLSANGPEGLIEFGEASASAQDVEVTDFSSDPVPFSIAFDC